MTTAPPPAFRHRGHERAAEPDAPHEIHLKRLLPPLIRHLLEDAGIADAEVVDQHVWRAAEGVEDVRHRAGDAGGRGEISGDAPPPRRSVRFQCGSVLVGHDDRRTFCGQQIGDRPADAVRAGADERKLFRELIVHAAIDNPARGTLTLSSSCRKSIIGCVNARAKSAYLDTLWQRFTRLRSPGRWRVASSARRFESSSSTTS